MSLVPDPTPSCSKLLWLKNAPSEREILGYKAGLPADITQITWASFNVSPMLGPGGICQTYFPYQILQDTSCSLNLHDNFQTAGSAMRSITTYQKAHEPALHRSGGKVCQLVQTPRASLRSVPTCKVHRANKDRAQETHCINNASALLGKHRPTRPLFFAFFSQGTNSLWMKQTQVWGTESSHKQQPRALLAKACCCCSALQCNCQNVKENMFSGWEMHFSLRQGKTTSFFNE